MHTFIKLATFSTVVTSAAAHAQSTPSNTTPNIFSGFLLGLLIVYLSRHRKIGGWLLYYYMQVYGGLLITGLLLTQSMSALDANLWEDKAMYAAYLGSVLPSMVVSVLEVIVSTRLLIVRNVKSLQWLRWVLIALLSANVLTVALDHLYFPDEPAVILDFLRLILSVIWLAYFYNSRRVKEVFIENRWSYEGQRQ